MPRRLAPRWRMRDPPRRKKSTGMTCHHGLSKGGQLSSPTAGHEPALEGGVLARTAAWLPHRLDDGPNSAVDLVCVARHRPWQGARGFEKRRGLPETSDGPVRPRCAEQPLTQHARCRWEQVVLPSHEESSLKRRRSRIFDWSSANESRIAAGSYSSSSRRTEPPGFLSQAAYGRFQVYIYRQGFQTLTRLSKQV